MHMMMLLLLLVSLCVGMVASATITLTPANDGFIKTGACSLSYCGSGNSLKAYQTVPPEECYGCNRRIVMAFPRPQQFSGATIIVQSAVLRMYKTWDGNAHNWQGNDMYTVRPVYANWTRDHLADAGVDSSLAPPPLQGATSQNVHIPSQTNAWVNISIGSLIGALYQRSEYGGGDISFDIAGASRGSLSAFGGSASATVPQLIITYTIGSPTTPFPSGAPTTPFPSLAPTAPVPVTTTSPTTSSPVTSVPTQSPIVGLLNLNPDDDGFIKQGDECSMAYCGSGQSLKAYQTVPAAVCYGCNRRIVMKFVRPSEFLAGQDFSITNATLRLYKTWDGNAHNWGGNDMYSFRAIYANWTDDHIIDAGFNASAAPRPVNDERVTVYISEAVNVWVNIDITSFINQLYHLPELSNGPVSFDIAGAQYGVLSAFAGSASDFPPQLSIEWSYLSTTMSPMIQPTTAPTEAPIISSPTRSPSSSPTSAPSTIMPTSEPSTIVPTAEPSNNPSRMPSTTVPTFEPTPQPTLEPTREPSQVPSSSSPTRVTSLGSNADEGSSGSTTTLLAVVIVVVLLVLLAAVVIVKKVKSNNASKEFSGAFENPMYDMGTAAVPPPANRVSPEDQVYADLDLKPNSDVDSSGYMDVPAAYFDDEEDV